MCGIVFSLACGHIAFVADRAEGGSITTLREACMLLLLLLPLLLLAPLPSLHCGIWL